MATFNGLSVAFLFVYTTGLTAFLLNPTQRCTFESGDCGYSQANSQRLHWSVRHVGGSNNPATDHTFNSAGKGTVLVVNADGVHGHYGKISTPAVHYARGQPATVRFSFINAGDHPMELVMFVKGGSRQPGSPSYTSIGVRERRRSKWHEVCIDDVVNGDVTVEFEAIVLGSGSSYLAIDDVTIDAGMTCSGAKTPYSGTMTTATPVAASVTCNFESASICGYVNVNSTDNIDWLHNRGSTPSQRTGPIHDHTTGSSAGHYMYIEASSHYHQKAIFESPSFTATGHQRLTFWYSMNGHGMGDLRVYLSNNGVRSNSPLFAKHGDTGTSDWKMACVDIHTHGSGMKILFEGTTGGSFTSDMAIDDVTLETGSCSTVTSPTSTVPTTSASTTVETVTLFEGHWGPWSSYSACSATCGSDVTRTRLRHCISGVCPTGNSSQSIACHMSDCPVTAVDGHWSTWSTSTCTVTCGTGLATSTRTCTNPAPSHGGQTCPGSSIRHSYCRISSSQCSVDGQWSTWSAYGACSVTCGTGQMSSHRSCTHPAPSGGGHNCVGSSLRTQSCTASQTSCVVDGNWSSWTTWSTCSVSCDLGTITRTRSCSQPAPSVGGRACIGDTTETHECTNGPCPEWSHWFNGDCSVSCGTGTRERMRACSTGNNHDCAGTSYETLPCDGPQCI